MKIAIVKSTYNLKSVETYEGAPIVTGKQIGRAHV